MIRALVIAFISAVVGQSHEHPPVHPTCTCTSVGAVAYSAHAGSPPVYGGQSSPPPAIGNGTSLLMTTDAAIATIAREIYPALVGTFACYCVVDPLNSLDTRYLLYANQTDHARGLANECLSTAVVDEVCAGLREIGVFECVTTWSGGASGLSSKTLYASGVLAGAMQKMCARHGPVCAETIEFLAVPDVLNDVILAKRR